MQRRLPPPGGAWCSCRSGAQAATPFSSVLAQPHTYCVPRTTLLFSTYFSFAFDKSLQLVYVRSLSRVKKSGVNPARLRARRPSLGPSPAPPAADHIRKQRLLDTSRRAAQLTSQVAATLFPEADNSRARSAAQVVIDLHPPCSAPSLPPSLPFPPPLLRNNVRGRSDRRRSGSVSRCVPMTETSFCREQRTRTGVQHPRALLLPRGEALSALPRRAPA